MTELIVHYTGQRAINDHYSLLVVHIGSSTKGRCPTWMNPLLIWKWRNVTKVEKGRFEFRISSTYKEQNLIFFQPFGSYS